MKLLVCGDRNYEDSKLLFSILNELHSEHKVIEVIHGAAKGADILGHVWAEEHGIKSTPVYADWKQFGRAAGPIRNNRMLEMQPDLVVAFHKNINDSKGTKNCLEQAEELGIKTLLIEKGEQNEHQKN